MTRLRFWVLSTPAGDGTEGNSFRPAIDGDFPHISSPGVDTGYTVAEAAVQYGWTHNVSNRTIGRDDNGEVVWVKLDTIPTYHTVVTQEGVRSQGNILVIDESGIRLAIAECDAEHTVAQAVHDHADYEVLAAVLHEDEDPDTVPAPVLTALEGWAPDVPFTTARRAGIWSYLVDRGVPPTWLSRWVTNNPVGTPREFYRSLRRAVQDRFVE
jgi:hypothetical protein